MMDGGSTSVLRGNILDGISTNGGAESTGQYRNFD